jgi:hypothetical protein
VMLNNTVSPLITPSHSASSTQANPQFCMSRLNLTITFLAHFTPKEQPTTTPPNPSQLS